MPAPPIRTIVPARPEAVRVVRTIANSAAAMESFGFDMYGDLDLAVDEAAAALLSLGLDGSLDLTVSPSPEGLQLALTLATDDRLAEWPPDDWPESLSAIVLGSIAGDVAYVLDAGRPSIRFTVARASV